MGAVLHVVHAHFPHSQTLSHFRFCMGCKRGVLLHNGGQTHRKRLGYTRHPGQPRN